MTLLENIVNSITDSTGITPVVEGGNRKSILEYKYEPIGKFYFRLSIYINGVDMLDVLDTTNKIKEALSDFGDINTLKGCSIEQSGGGSFNEGARVTTLLIFDVYDYSLK